MANQLWPDVDEPAETGPDYVALVIEWDESEDDITGLIERPVMTAAPHRFKKILVGAGVLGALMLARWGVHRLRTT